MWEGEWERACESVVRECTDAMRQYRTAIEPDTACMYFCSGKETRMTFGYSPAQSADLIICENTQSGFENVMHRAPKPDCARRITARHNTVTSSACALHASVAEPVPDLLPRPDVKPMSASVWNQDNAREGSHGEYGVSNRSCE
jgi:hypothetical protein